MNLQEIINTLTEFQRCRAERYEVGTQIRLRCDHQLHTITDIEKCDHNQPFKVDGCLWVGYDDIEQPNPYTVGIAIECAIEKLNKLNKQPISITPDMRGYDKDGSNYV